MSNTKEGVEVKLLPVFTFISHAQFISHCSYQMWFVGVTTLTSKLVGTLEQLPSNQSFEKQISSHKKNGAVRGVCNGLDIG